jgi:hypothetical protein
MDSRVTFAVGVCAFAFCFNLDLQSAGANSGPATQDQSRRVRSTATNGELHVTRNAAGRYFVEFRSRSALSYGHTFIVHGRMNERGPIASSQVAGLHPAGDDPTPWLIGHIIPVPSETGPSDGDLDERYVSARYRVQLSEPEYRRVTAYIKQLQASSPTWHAITYNCNAFVADIARYMGLQTPSSTLLYPADFISELRTLNSGLGKQDTTSGQPTTN